MEDADYEKTVNHPKHYVEQSARIEPIELCERMGFNLGNALKYLIRAGHKVKTFEGRIEDMEKARWYLQRAEENGAFLPRDARFDAVTKYLLKNFAISAGFKHIEDLISLTDEPEAAIRALRLEVEDKIQVCYANKNMVDVYDRVIGDASDKLAKDPDHAP